MVRAPVRPERPVHEADRRRRRRHHRQRPRHQHLTEGDALATTRLDEALDLIRRASERADDPRVKEILARAENAVRSFADATQSERQKLLETLAQSKTQIADLEAANEALKAQNADQAKELAGLRDQLSKEAPVSRAAPVDLAKSFRAVIDEIQAEARAAGEVGVTVKSMDIEVKGLVEVEEERTALVLPSAKAQIDPNALSTLRVSFGAVPVLPTPEAAPQPEPGIAPSRRRPRRPSR